METAEAEAGTYIRVLSSQWAMITVAGAVLPEADSEVDSEVDSVDLEAAPSEEAEQAAAGSQESISDQ